MLYKCRCENLAEDINCRPLCHVQDDFAKSCSDRRPGSRTLETPQEIKSFSSSGEGLLQEISQEGKIFKLTLINLQCSQVDRFRKHLSINRLVTTVMFVQKIPPCSRKKTQTHQAFDSNVVLKFRFYAEERSGIAALLVRRVQIPNASRELAKDVSFHEHFVQIKSKHYIQATS